jgi:hypothetical protein
MKITDKILSIPPYISTNWRSVDHLKVEGGNLIVTLMNGQSIKIPALDEATIRHVFHCHANSLEGQERRLPPPPSSGLRISSLPIGIELGGLADMGAIMGHNPAQANAPDLPVEITSSIRTIADMVGLDLASFQIPGENPDCNCPYCQIAKSLHKPSLQEPEESVTEEDLRFKDWEVTQTSEKLFEVIHPLDAEEHYQVFLGNPIGCTCGKNDCEHIRAVLLST